MKAIILTALLVLICFTLQYAQTVSTLVPGLSSFNDGLAIDDSGNIYASMYNGSTVTKITPSGNASIFATGFNSPNGLAFGPDKNLYVPNAFGNRVDKVTPEGIVSLYINIPNPGKVYFDNTGLMYVVNYNDNVISTVDSMKRIDTLYSGGVLNGPIEIIKDGAGKLYIGNFTDGKVFRVDDNNTFTQIGDLPGNLGFGTLINDAIYATDFLTHRIYKIPTDGSGQTVFAGTGTRGTVNGPVATARFNSPNGIASTSTGDTIYVSDYGNRSLRMITGVLTPTSVSEDLINESRNFNIEQNYPNPFNPETKIRWYQPYTAKTSVKVFDITGNLITELLNNEMPAGNHEVNFNARYAAAELPSGIYFFRIEAGSFSETRKMVLLK
ncbi:MAG: T9SS type A sorting domain-containing protein [Ignavibacteriaceae bacterium]|nr:T9SS type A sorting domain-containing protein [Ignavibacteriaceae bacterium]